MALHPDGVRLASGSSDGTVKIWDTGSLFQLQPETNAGLSAIFPGSNKYHTDPRELRPAIPIDLGDFKGREA